MPSLHTKAPVVLDKHPNLCHCLCLSQTTMNKTSNKESSPNPVPVKMFRVRQNNAQDHYKEDKSFVRNTIPI